MFERDDSGRPGSVGGEFFGEGHGALREIPHSGSSLGMTILIGSSFFRKDWQELFGARAENPRSFGRKLRRALYLFYREGQMSLLLLYPSRIPIRAATGLVLYLIEEQFSVAGAIA